MAEKKADGRELNYRKGTDKMLRSAGETRI
jgi:hypothetical protein